MAHFIFTGPGDKPLDVFVVNVHLTTLRREREGIPEIDLAGERIRRGQLEIVFFGIVSSYNSWRSEQKLTKTASNRCGS